VHEHICAPEPVFALQSSLTVSRRQRQLDELRSLCRSGAVARAADLAHGFVAEFGPDDELLTLLLTAVEQCGASGDLRRRIDELGAGWH
jgi:hypothetical protein